MAQTISKKIFDKVFKPGTDPAFDEIDLKGTHYEPYMDVILENIRFLRDIEWEMFTIKSFDDAELVAYYYNASSDKTAIICHGYRSHYLSNSACPGKYFIEQGYNVLIIVSRGHLNSGGKYITFGEFESKDLLNWISYLEKEKNASKIVLYGVSLGSNTVMRASEGLEDKNIKAMVLDCGFRNTLSTIFNQVKHQCKPSWLWGPYLVVSTPVIIRMGFIGKKLGGFNIFKGDTVESIKASHLPAFFIHGAKDRIVPLKLTKKNFEACPNKKELYVAKEAEHGAAFAAGGKELSDKLTKFLAECGV